MPGKTGKPQRTCLRYAQALSLPDSDAALPFIGFAKRILLLAWALAYYFILYNYNCGFMAYKEKMNAFIRHHSGLAEKIQKSRDTEIKLEIEEKFNEAHTLIEGYEFVLVPKRK